MPNGTWYTYLGYGLVDAYAAVLKVQQGKDRILDDRTIVTTKSIICDDINVKNITISNYREVGSYIIRINYDNSTIYNQKRRFF